MVSKVERLHVYLPNALVEVPTGHAKKPPPLPRFSEGEKINFTVPPPNQLLSPVLSTSRSGDFRNGLTSKKRKCLPTQILHWSADNPMGKKTPSTTTIFRKWKIDSTVSQPKQLLKPFLSTSRSGEFKTGLNNKNMYVYLPKSCIEVPTAQWEKPLHYHNFQEVNKLTSRYRHQINF